MPVVVSYCVIVLNMLLHAVIHLHFSWFYKQIDGRYVCCLGPLLHPRHPQHWKRRSRRPDLTPIPLTPDDVGREPTTVQSMAPRLLLLRSLRHCCKQVANKRGHSKIEHPCCKQVVADGNDFGSECPAQTQSREELRGQAPAAHNFASASIDMSRAQQLFFSGCPEAWSPLSRVACSWSHFLVFSCQMRTPLRAQHV